MTARTTKRFAVLAACAIAAMPILAGCTPASSDAPSTNETQSEASADSLLPPAEGKTKYPLTLTTPWGETVLKERPERIAVVGGNGDLEATVALGVSPVTAPRAFSEYPWLDAYADAASEVTVVNTWQTETFPFEAVAAATPDLIVAHTSSILSEVYERLSAIAPVLTSKAGTAFGAKSTDWRAITRSIGKALDLADRADKAVQETDDYVAAIAERHPEWAGRTIGFVLNDGEENGLVFVNRAGSSTEELTTALGFAPHPNAAKIGTENLSLENLALVDADLLLIHQTGEEEDRVWLDSSPLYQRLGAVQRGAVTFTAFNGSRDWTLPWALSWPDVLNLRHIVDTLETSLAPIIDK